MHQLTIDEAFNLAVQHQQGGRLREAEEVYRRILAEQPNHAMAIHHLGMIAIQTGRTGPGADLIRRSIALNSNYPDAHNNLGIALQIVGKLDEAIAAYQRAIALRPNYPEALLNFGIANKARGELDQAIAAFQRAIAQRPDYPDAHENLGSALQAKERPKEAIAAYRRAISLRPNHAETYINLGAALKENGEFDEAIAACGRAIALKGNLPVAHLNLGNALLAKEMFDEAIAAYQTAITLNPNYAESHHNLGTALKAHGRVEEAIAAYRRAIFLRPDLVESHIDLSSALKENGQFDDAIAASRQAIALNATVPEAHLNLGNALLAKGELDEAIAAYDKAIRLRPDLADAHNGLGAALKTKGQFAEAIAACRRAISIQADFPEAHLNLGNALKDSGRLGEACAAYERAISLRPHYPEGQLNLGIAHRAAGQLDEAIADYQKAICFRPNYADAYLNLGAAMKDRGQLDKTIAAYRQAMAARPSYTDAHSNLVYTLHFHHGYDARAIALEHREWNQRHAEPLKRYIEGHCNDRDADRRLRIGYVSPDFREHPIGRFLLPLLENHDDRNFEIFAYDNAPDLAADAMTPRIRSHFDVWRSIVGLSDEQAADLIRQDRVDILVDLTLHMAHNRMLLFARKPAPMQVTYLAYAGSSGLSTMDYRLSDPYIDPPGDDESVYSEKTVRLPETYWCYAPVADLAVAPPPALGNGFITFGCLNNFCKVNEPLLELWSRILTTVSDSRLILHAPDGRHRQHVLDYLQGLGIEPQRVGFAGRLPAGPYFALHNSIDIVLDTLPYGGGTTSCDALWMGVPMVSLVGKTAVGRSGLSILSNVGLPELVGYTGEEYVQIAVGLSNDLARLTQLRSTLRQRMEASPLMNAPKFARSMEAVYRRIWRTWCDTEGNQAR